MNDERSVSIMDEFEVLRYHEIFSTFGRFFAFSHLKEPITFFVTTVCLSLQENPVNGSVSGSDGNKARR